MACDDDDWQSVLKNFRLVLQSADPKQILLTAEAAVSVLSQRSPGSATGTPAAVAAAAAIGESIGYPYQKTSLYSARQQRAFESIILNYLQTLRPFALTISGLNWFY
jgi:hypothetical protein